MNTQKYILDESRNVILAAGLIEWARWFELSDNRQVARDEIGETYVSTVFLGLDYNFASAGEPILWETMVFGGPFADESERCSGTWQDAEAMHAQIVERVRNAA